MDIFKNSSPVGIVTGSSFIFPNRKKITIPLELKCNYCGKSVSDVGIVIYYLHELNQLLGICVDCEMAAIFNKVKFNGALPKDILTHIMSFCISREAINVLYMSKSVLNMFSSDEIFRIKLKLAEKKYLQLTRKRPPLTFTDLRMIDQIEREIEFGINTGTITLNDYLKARELYIYAKNSKRLKFKDLLTDIRISFHLLGFEIPDVSRDTAWRFSNEDFYTDKTVIKKIEAFENRYKKKLRYPQLDFNYFFGKEIAWHKKISQNPWGVK